MDVLQLVTEEEREDAGRTWYAVDPAVMYPAVIERIRQVIDEEIVPPELVDALDSLTPGIDPTAAALRIVNRCKKVSSAAWGNALKPRSDFGSASSKDVVERAEALECARAYFTRALKKQVSPLGIHILNDPAYKLEAVGY